MPDVSLVKNIGFNTGLQVIDKRSAFEYPVEHVGASTHVGANADEIRIILSGSPNTAAAVAILAAVDLPSCAAAVLTVTVSVGTYLVNDTTVIADGVDKFALVCLALDNITGALEVLVFEKSGPLSEYGETPFGKTLVAKLKEYQIVAAALVEIRNLIS